MLDRWADPVEMVDAEHDWVEPLLPYYLALLTLLEPMGADALVQRHQQGALDVLDLKPEPTTVALANERWREFVRIVWGLAEGYWRRQAVAEKARRPRGAPPRD